MFLVEDIARSLLVLSATTNIWGGRRDHLELFRLPEEEKKIIFLLALQFIVIFAPLDRRDEIVAEK